MSEPDNSSGPQNSEDNDANEAKPREDEKEKGEEAGNSEVATEEESSSSDTNIERLDIRGDLELFDSSCSPNNSGTSDPVTSEESESFGEIGGVSSIEKDDNGAINREAATMPTAEPAAEGTKDSSSGVHEGDTEAVAAAAAAASASQPKQEVYQLKWIKWKTREVPIITQNENGPCPLIAIMNVLLLKSAVHLPTTNSNIVTPEQLLGCVGDYILEQAPKHITESNRLNYEQNVQDAVAILHKLQTGLDVNVRFTGVRHFEYTPECAVFDLMSIGLYHGWLVDPQNAPMSAAVSSCSYNQLVEKIISLKSDELPEKVQEGLVAESFLDSTASQLTYHGLCELNSAIKEDELCVFFRNNHFSTLYKHKDELFLLVTDQGFLNERRVVWETLANTEGDCCFVDCEFHTVPPIQPPPPPPPQPAADPDLTKEQQIDQDYLVALTIQEEQQQIQKQQQTQQPDQSPSLPAATATATATAAAASSELYGQLTDHELAMQLQEEENLRAEQEQTRRQQRPAATRGAPTPAGAAAQPSGQAQRRQEDKCCIL